MTLSIRLDDGQVVGRTLGLEDLTDLEVSFKAKTLSLWVQEEAFMVLAEGE